MVHGCSDERPKKFAKKKKYIVYSEYMYHLWYFLAYIRTAFLVQFKLNHEFVFLYWCEGIAHFQFFTFMKV